MARKKPTPLQQWRMSYAEISFMIGSAKKAARNSHKWGDFKRPQAQRLAAILRPMARDMMEHRKEAAMLTRIMWETDRLKRDAAGGHPIPNTTNPADKV